jgi:hypothetical protein
MDISASGVVLKPVSPNKLNLRYLEHNTTAADSFGISEATSTVTDLSWI